MSPRFRHPAIETLQLWIEDNCGGEKAEELIRTLVDVVQVSCGEQILRNLRNTRAYHATQGSLGDMELLHAGYVKRLVRSTTGMEAEPGQPVERETRKQGSLSERLRQRR